MKFISQYAVGDIRGTANGQMFPVQALVDIPGTPGRVAIQVLSGAYAQLQPLSAEEGFYRWAETTEASGSWVEAKVQGNGALITLAPHGNLAFTFGLVEI